jgi:class 3 adenylate cyclase/tetratricopeptide (TPR) repeat protein
VSDLAAAVLAGGSQPRWVEVDGTLAFFDVSGFTPLTERLAGLGRAGAEHINDVLNATFGALIEIVVGHGGDVLEFGGDAMVVHFAGSDHGPRAAAAAGEVVSWMRRHGTLSTPAGRVRLGISCGVATGTQAYHLCGDTRRALVVAGPVSTAMARLESAASAGEVRIDGGLAALLPASWVGGDAGEHHLVPDAVRDVPRATGRLDAAGCGVDTVLLLPSQFRELADVGRRSGELKQVAVAFLRLTGTDDLAADAGVDALHARLREISALVDAEAAALDVCWLETQAEANSVRWTLIAGAPTSTEHDGERLLAVLRRIVDHEPSLRVGANLGVVFVGDMGHPERCTFIVMGDTTNVAARLMARAEPGQIIAGERLARAAVGAFEVTPLPPIRVKGKRVAVTASAIGRRAVDVASDGAPPHRLVGRDDELAVLVAAIARGDSVEIVAEAGIGKSALWSEARSRSSGPPWMVERANPNEIASPYLPVRRLLRRLLDLDALDDEPAHSRLRSGVVRLAEHLEPWLPLIAEVVGIDVIDTEDVAALAPAFRAERTHGVVAELLVVAATGTLVVEDAHRLDEGSRGVLEHLLRSADRPRVAVVITRRPGGWEPPVDTSIALDPLDADEARQLLLDELPPELASDATLDRLSRSAGGNPMFLVELARSMAAGSSEIPESVERVLAARIDRLPPSARRLIRDVSVLGPTVDRSLLAHVLDRPELDRTGTWRDEFDGLLSADDERVWFEHDLVRTAAYEGLSVGRRRELHVRAGDVIEQWGPDVPLDDPVAALAFHAAGSEIPARIVEWGGRAAAVAMEKGAMEVAASMLASVADAQTRTRTSRADRLAVYRRLAEARERAGHQEAALEALQRAGRLVGDDPQERGDLAVDRVRILEKLGRYRSALSASTRAAGATDDVVVRGRLLLAGATIRNFLGQWAQCLEVVDGLLADPRLSGELRLRAQAHLLAEWCCTTLGRPERLHHEQEAERLLAELDDSVGLANLYLNLGVSAWQEHRVDDAVSRFQAAAERYRRAGDVVGAALADNNVAEILTLQVRLDPARELLEQSLRVTRAAAYPLGVAIATSGLARVAAWTGDLERALELQTAALGRFEELGAGDYVVDALARLAEIHLLRALAEVERATEVLDRADREVGEHGEVAVVPATLARLRAYALIQRGRIDGARAMLDRAAELAARDDAAYESALVLLGQGRVLDDPATFDRGIDALASLGADAPPPGTDPGEGISARR